MKRDPSSLGDVLAEAVARLDLLKRLRQEQAVALWREAVGEEIFRHARARDVRGGVLHVRVRNAAWANQLVFLKDRIVARINEAAGEPVVHDLRLTTTGPWDGDETAVPGPSPLPGDVRLLPEERQWTADVTSEIGDAPLRATVRKAVAGALMRKKKLLATGWRPCPRCGSAHDGRRELCPPCREDGGG